MSTSSDEVVAKGREEAAKLLADGVDMSALSAVIRSFLASQQVSASAKPVILDFTCGTYTTDKLEAGNFTINGIQILGTPAAATPAALVDVVSAKKIQGIDASVVSGQLRLTSDGRDIRVQTNGMATSMNFTNFPSAEFAAFEIVKRGSVVPLRKIAPKRSITLGELPPVSGSEELQEEPDAFGILQQCDSAPLESQEVRVTSKVSGVNLGDLPSI